MGKNLYDFAENMIRNNPNLQNDPRAQKLADIIHNRDDAAGIELANQFLRDNGLSQQSGIEQAMRFLGLNQN